MGVRRSSDGAWLAGLWGANRMCGVGTDNRKKAGNTATRVTDTHNGLSPRRPA